MTAEWLKRQFDAISQPLPEILTDRSVGLRGVPQMYRSYGLRVVTIAEHFGETKVPDEVWIEWSARQGMIAVCKDDRIRALLTFPWVIGRGVGGGVGRG